MRLRAFAWAGLGLLASVHVGAQQLRDARMLANEVDVSQEAQLALNLDKTSAIVWCGLRVDFGNGSDQHLRVGERGDADLQPVVRYRYPVPGLYTVKVSGAPLMRGLRSVSACGGRSISVQVRVTDRGVAPGSTASAAPAVPAETLVARSRPEGPVPVDAPRPAPGPVYPPLQSPGPDYLPTAGAPAASLPPPSQSPGDHASPAALPSAPSPWAAGTGQAGGQAMHDCGPRPDAACVARTLAETVIRLREAFAKHKAGSTATAAAPPSPPGSYTAGTPAVQTAPWNAGGPTDPRAPAPAAHSTLPPPAGAPAYPGPVDTSHAATASAVPPGGGWATVAAPAMPLSRPEPPTPTQAAATWPKPPAGARTPLEGVYYVQRTSMLMNGGIALSHEAFFFTSNGRFSHAPQGGMDLGTLAAQSAPGPGDGSYWIDGGELVMAWADGRKPWRSRYENDARKLTIGTSFASRQAGFPPGWRLEGSYEGGASIGAGTSSSSAVHFRRDGTFTRGSSAAVVSTSRTSQVTGSGSASGTGTYGFDGFTLTLREGGKERRFTVFAYGDRDASGRPEHIFNDGLMMKRQ